MPKVDDASSGHLPALLRARKLSSKLARQNSAALATIDPYLLLQQLQTALENRHKPRTLGETLGDLLLITVDLGRRLGLDAEDALRQAVKRHAKILGT